MNFLITRIISILKGERLLAEAYWGTGLIGFSISSIIFLVSTQIVASNKFAAIIGLILFLIVYIITFIIWFWGTHKCMRNTSSSFWTVLAVLSVYFGVLIAIGMIFGAVKSITNLISN